MPEEARRPHRSHHGTASKIETVCDPAFAETRSRLPSRLKSPIATDHDDPPVVRLTFGAKVGAVEPGTVVLSNSVMSEKGPAEITSGLPSPLRSPMARISWHVCVMPGVRHSHVLRSQLNPDGQSEAALHVTRQSAKSAP